MRQAVHFAGKEFAWITGPAGIVLGILLVLGVSALLYRAGRSGEADLQVEETLDR